MSTERDYPKNHPAASDYDGSPWTPPAAPYREDFAAGHGARNGANVSVLDTPDGMRAAHNKRAQDLGELAAVGSLPPLRDPKTNEPIQIDSAQLKHIYAVRNGLSPAMAQQVTERYNLDPMPERKAEETAPAITGKEQAIAYIVSLGYTPEQAETIFEKYGEPAILADREAAAHR